MDNAPNPLIPKLINGIDVLEDELLAFDPKLLDTLLFDRTSRKNILWATTDYQELGQGYEELSEITTSLVTGLHKDVIQPRAIKDTKTQVNRTRNKAEVFTPTWICNKQNNLIDEKWFEYKDPFNQETGQSWKITPGPLHFPSEKKDWHSYVDAQRLEISCGEAPYLVSRYDTTTGHFLPLFQRIGLLDRKMRVVSENAKTYEEWLKWSQRAFESTYGFDYMGDNVLLARENLLYSYIEYYQAQFDTFPALQLLHKIARIISWNIWQMDGLKLVIPGSCVPEPDREISMFEFLDDSPFYRNDELIPNSCFGCRTGEIDKHTGIYCRIMDWRYKCSRTVLSLLQRRS